MTSWIQMKKLTYYWSPRYTSLILGERWSSWFSLMPLIALGLSMLFLAECAHTQTHYKWNAGFICGVPANICVYSWVDYVAVVKAIHFAPHAHRQRWKNMQMENMEHTHTHNITILMRLVVLMLMEITTVLSNTLSHTTHIYRQRRKQNHPSHGVITYCIMLWRCDWF